LDRRVHASSQSRLRKPWLIVTLAALGIIALAVGVVHFAPVSCAATAPAYGTAVFYDPTRAEDRCSIEPLSRDGRYASLPRTQYQGGAVCGAYLDITGPHGIVQAEIVDMCAGCAGTELDLSANAFAAIEATTRGTAPVSYQLARDPALPGPLAVRVGAGSTSASLAIQILNHGNPLSAVVVNGQPLALRPDGYWITRHSTGGGPFTVRVTDVAGHSAVLTAIALRPGAIQQTSVLMYGTTTPAPSPGPVIQRASVPPAKPAPSPSCRT
jgi:expansin (peptidoglycan-binding protein)